MASRQLKAGASGPPITQTDSVTAPSTLIALSSRDSSSPAQLGAAQLPPRICPHPTMEQVEGTAHEKITRQFDGECVHKHNDEPL